jgi:hypothetical protein
VDLISWIHRDRQNNWSFLGQRLQACNLDVKIECVLSLLDLKPLLKFKLYVHMFVLEDVLDFSWQQIYNDFEIDHTALGQWQGEG